MLLREKRAILYRRAFRDTHPCDDAGPHLINAGHRPRLKLYNGRQESPCPLQLGLASKAITRVFTVVNMTADPYGNRNILTVFLASPGDLRDERRFTRDAVVDVNETVRRIGWQIDLRGWEDTLPGHGRPQALINVDVSACQLFIGLIHTRWGSPTGTFSSGFEEEFRLACMLREKHGSPEVWLFFKAISDAQKRDPGEQLQRVLDFRSEIEQRRLVLFRDFKNKSEWKKSIRQCLLQYVLELDKKATQRTEPASSALPNPVRAGVTDNQAPAAEEQPVTAQLAETLRSAQVHTSAPDDLASFEAIRLHLFSSTALYRRIGIRLGIHEANLLYLHRQELKPTDPERRLLLSTVVADSGTVIPGWYWFRQEDAEATKRNLLHLAAFWHDEDVRTAAARLLTETNLQPDIKNLPRETVVSRILRESSPEARGAKIDYLARVGCRADLPALDRLLEDPSPQVRTKAEQAHAIILARDNPNRLLEEVAEQRQGYFKELGEELERQASGIDASILAAAVRHPEPAVRLFAATQLAQRNAINLDLAKRLTHDTSEDVQTIGYRILLQSSEQVDPERVEDGVRRTLQPLFAERKSTAPVAALRNEVEWYSTDGQEAYEALAKFHFAEFAAQMRSDLNDGFQQLRGEWIQRMRSRYGSEADKLVRRLSADVDRFIRDSFTVTALTALAEHGMPQDAVIARRFLDFDRKVGRTAVPRAAIRILERFGDESDCAGLLDLGKKEWSVARQAAMVAIRLSRRASSVFHALLESGEPELVETGLLALTSDDLSEFMSAVQRLLRHESAVIRVLAVACLHRLADRVMLEEILCQYPVTSPYFYNVVCWLDRVLYAPPPLRAVFALQLQKPYLSRFSSILDD
jgi:hypothetical protein